MLSGVNYIGVISLNLLGLCELEECPHVICHVIPSNNGLQVTFLFPPFPILVVLWDTCQPSLPVQFPRYGAIYVAELFMPEIDTSGDYFVSVSSFIMKVMDGHTHLAPMANFSTCPSLVRVRCL